MMQDTQTEALRELEPQLRRAIDAAVTKAAETLDLGWLAESTTRQMTDAALGVLRVQMEYHEWMRREGYTDL